MVSKDVVWFDYAKAERVSFRVDQATLSTLSGADEGRTFSSRENPFRVHSPHAIFHG